MVQRGRVELEELEVGHSSAGTHRDRHTVARGRRGVRRDRVQLAGTPGREQDVARRYGMRHSVPRQARRAYTAPVAHDQRLDEGLLVDHHGAAPHRRHECPLDLRAGRGAACMHHTGDRMTALTGELEVALGIAIELGSECDQFLDPTWALVHEHTHCVVVAEPRSRSQSVREVQVDLLGVRRERRGHTSLCPSGGRLLEATLGHDPDPQPVLRGGAHRGRQPGDARTDDQEIQCVSLLVVRHRAPSCIDTGSSGSAGHCDVVDQPGSFELHGSEEPGGGVAHRQRSQRVGIGNLHVVELAEGHGVDHRGHGVTNHLGIALAVDDQLRTFAKRSVQDGGHLAFLR